MATVRKRIAYEKSLPIHGHRGIRIGPFGQGTASTYQGCLNDGSNPASGIYDLRFTVYDGLAGGGVAGGSLTNPPPWAGLHERKRGNSGLARILRHLLAADLQRGAQVRA